MDGPMGAAKGRRCPDCGAEVPSLGELAKLARAIGRSLHDIGIRQGDANVLLLENDASRLAAELACHARSCIRARPRLQRHWKIHARKRT
jgi:acyl-CoA synthetase (AMP-forming)/AMP-acid ligase II